MAAAKGRSLVRSATATPTRSRTAIPPAGPRHSASTPKTAMQGMRKAATAHAPQAMSTARTARVRLSRPITGSMLNTTRATDPGAADMPRRATTPIETLATMAANREATVARTPPTTALTSTATMAPDTHRTREMRPMRTPHKRTPPPMQPTAPPPRPPHCPSRSRAWSSSCSQTDSTR